ncbi:putative HD superfamily hydrolase involved in NAD metabolism [Geomicrobium halophilum]|uniref:bis(5'-nucleosyl)-tetraphosphatase (symmetrical) n=1 Tax=Geomicrobium halophilum TaxID=549000 RepID=A0A841PXQ9_9BACL|nr:bis(5'-nucleosyl)-tetraphosphatase (symmetrical) YqeK [Geomicrobium halophilum]MBB6448805.1 putative HD superfamily hydrolase involved in NAD metabolism [Geomicrobium halophilum]
MSVEHFQEKVQQTLPQERYHHTLGVMKTAVTLAKQNGVDETKAELAALLHDYAKPFSRQTLTEVLKRQEPHETFSEYGGVLLHAPAGAYIVRDEFGVDDEEIFQAIYWHTTGRPEMSLFEKIIFLADYIEPGRSFSGIEEVRKLTEIDLDAALLATYRNTIQHLVRGGKMVHPMTLAAYNDAIKQKNKRGA